jgi:hypothetical protein
VKQKGAAIKSTLQAIANLRDAAALDAVKGALPAAIRAQIEPHVLPVAWYGVEVTAAIHVAIRDVLGGGQWSFSHTIGVEAARIDFNGIYRLFLRSMQYDSLWDRVARAWETYNSQGHPHWEDRTNGSAKGVVTGVSGFNVGMWNAVAGRCESLLTLGGARGASVEVREANATSCRMDALWLE